MARQPTKAEWIVLNDPEVVERDLFADLGLKWDAGSPAVKAAYRALSQLYHSDKPTRDEQNYGRVDKANKILSDPVLREAYISIYLGSRLTDDDIAQRARGGLHERIGLYRDQPLRSGPVDPEPCHEPMPPGPPHPRAGTTPPPRPYTASRVDMNLKAPSFNNDESVTARRSLNPGNDVGLERVHGLAETALRSDKFKKGAAMYFAARLRLSDRLRAAALYEAMSDGRARERILLEPDGAPRRTPQQRDCWAEAVVAEAAAQLVQNGTLEFKGTADDVDTPGNWADEAYEAFEQSLQRAPAGNDVPGLNTP